MRYSIDEDRALISECISGNVNALENLIRRYSPLVYRYVQQTFVSSNVPFDEEDLKEHHNSVFVLLLEKKCRKLRQFRGTNGCSLASWIRLITCRAVLNQMRENSGDATWFHKRVPIEEASDIFSEEKGAMESLEDEEKKIFIKECIQKLNPRDRLFLKLHIEQELPIQRVALIMQISEANTHTLKHRSIERLKKMIENSIKEKF
ncbi:RNA polymerase sigma-70 domain protein [Candidatus Magnetomorum sp. HK-1]|nr:RNA polymerase sigma-70 domain protein [Candidatus Magnetomorum sp. HK-1]